MHGVEKRLCLGSLPGEKLRGMKTTILLVAILSLLPIANISEAQTAPESIKRLRSPASVRGIIGGESHDRYVIRVKRGRVLTVRLSWRREGDNQAEFDVTRSANGNSEPVEFGKWSNDHKRWIGQVPKSGDYYVEVVAHPTARYTLSVMVK